MGENKSIAWRDKGVEEKSRGIPTNIGRGISLLCNAYVSR